MLAYGVGSNVDVLLLAVGNELRLDEERVALDLVGSGGDASALDDSLELYILSESSFYTCWLEGTYVLLSVVGNTDSASLGLGQLGHGYTWRG